MNDSTKGFPVTLTPKERAFPDTFARELTRAAIANGFRYIETFEVVAGILTFTMAPAEQMADGIGFLGEPASREEYRKVLVAARKRFVGLFPRAAKEPGAEIPDHPMTAGALAAIHKLGETLEAQGFDHMARHRETTDAGHATYFLGLYLQELVDDGKLDEAYGAHLSTQEG